MCSISAQPWSVRVIVCVVGLDVAPGSHGGYYEAVMRDLNSAPSQEQAQHTGGIATPTGVLFLSQQTCSV